MPSKHIQDKTWERVKEQFVRAVVTTKAGFKETEILNFLIEKGIENITDEDYINFLRKNVNIFLTNILFVSRILAVLYFLRK